MIPIIEPDSEHAKLLVLVQDVREIGYGDILYIKTNKYYAEIMRQPYKFENKREFNEYKNYFRYKVRDKQCFKLKNNG